MKQILSIAIAAISIVIITSCTTHSTKAILAGKIKGLKENTVLFGGVLNPHTDTIVVCPDGSFNAEYSLSEPKTDYIIIMNPKSGFKIYLEPNSRLNCQVETYDTLIYGQPATRCRVKFTGNNADCNEFLNNEQLHYYTLQGEALEEAMTKKLSFVQFKELLGRKVEFAKKEMEKLSNPRFIETNKIDYDQKFKAILDYYGEFIPQQDEEYKAYLTSVNLNNLTNKNKAGMYAKYYQQFELPTNDEDINITYLQLLPKLYTNHEVISILADEKIEGIMSQAPSNIEAIFSTYRTIKGRDSIPAHIQEQFNRVSAISTGKKAIDFDMYDVSGKKVMLSDLQGKAVYMDCWATWCGPCKAEIPYMEKLYEHYKSNPNIIVVSVSIDKTPQPWLNMLEKDKPQWPQYIIKDEFKSKLCTAYNITGIPRFMMFDKEGNVISLNAPRPSSEEIIQFIDNALKQ